MLPSDRQSMDALTRGLGDNKSAKIRCLKQAGYRQADIARHLGVSDQFVSNVVRHSACSSGPDEPARAGGQELSTGAPVRMKVQVGPGGRIVIPAAIRDAMDAGEGTTLFARFEDGEFVLSTADAVIRRVQRTVRQYVPEGAGLVDELIAERRREAARENGDG